MGNNYISKYSGKQVDAAVNYFLNHSQYSENSSEYTISIFCESENGYPASPFNTSNIPCLLPEFPFSGQDGKLWVDVPNSNSGYWYQCVITINNISKNITKQGTVLKLTSSSSGSNGKDGLTPFIGDNGNWWIGNTDTGVPTKADSSGKDGLTPFIGTNGNWWIGDTDTGVKAEGPQGIAGPQGSNGIDGLPGISMSVAFTIGNENGIKPDAANPLVSPYKDDYTALLNSNTGWTQETPSTTSEYPYIWFTQCRYIQQINDGNITYAFEQGSSWSKPARYTGLNGITKTEVIYRKNPIIYPSGLFELNKQYVNDGNKTPYVYYNGNYYYLSHEGTWSSTIETTNPHNSKDSEGTLYWTLMESFEALYAKVGIIPNGLIGSAVFNGDYMFSQQGFDIANNPSTNYELFLKDINGNNLTNPLDTSSAFKPNYVINFKTGEFWSSSVSSEILKMSSGITLKVKDDINNEMQFSGIDISSGKVKITGEFEGTANGIFNGDVKASSFTVIDKDGRDALKFINYNSSLGSPQDGSTIQEGTPVMVVNYKGNQYITSLVKLVSNSSTTINYIEKEMVTSSIKIATTIDTYINESYYRTYYCITEAPHLSIRKDSTDTGDFIKATLRDANGSEIQWDTIYNKYYINCPIVRDDANCDINNGILSYKLTGSFPTVNNVYTEGKSRVITICRDEIYFNSTVSQFKKVNIIEGIMSSNDKSVLLGNSYTVKKYRQVGNDYVVYEINMSSNKIYYNIPGTELTAMDGYGFNAMTSKYFASQIGTITEVLDSDLVMCETLVVSKQKVG